MTNGKRNALAAAVPVAAQALLTVEEFAKSVRKQAVSEGHQWAHESHPLVLFVQGVLEGISTAELETKIVALSRASRERLVAARLRLEDRDEKHELQNLIYWFEQLCDVLEEIGYREEGRAESQQFFGEVFPGWLESFEEWAEAAGQKALMKAIAAARAAYLPIADEIVPDGEDD